MSRTALIAFAALGCALAASARPDAPETPAPRPEPAAAPAATPAPPQAPEAPPAPPQAPPAAPPAEEPATTAAAPPPPAPAPLPFRPGESMEFTVHYLGIKMGTARIWVGEPEGELLPLHLLARTGGIAALFDVRQELTSRLGPSGLPQSSLIEAVEGSYRHTDTTIFDREAGTAKVTVKGKYLTVKEVAIPPDAIDFVALVFRLRQVPLEPGARHEFDVLAGTTVKRVVARVLSRERVETKAGAFPAVKVQVPTGFTGKFSEKDPTVIWLSDDARRVVVRLATDFAIGKAVATLTAYGPGKAAE